MGISKSGYIFAKTIYILFSVVLIAITSVGLWLVSQVVYLRAYIYTVSGISAAAYVIAIIFLVLGIKLKEIDIKKPKRVKAGAVITTIMLIALIAGVTLQYMDLVSTSPPKFYLRENEINAPEPSKYNFTTTYGNLNRTLEEIFVLPQTPPGDVSNFAWGESYTLRMITHMYNLTKNDQYLLLAIDRIDQIIAKSDPNGDSIPGFGITYQGGTYLEFVVDDAMIMFPIIEFANMLKYGGDSNAFNEIKYKFDFYAEVAQKIVWKWNKTNWIELGNDTNNEPMGAYLAPPENIQMIFNRNNAMGRLFIELYRYTNNNSYRVMAEKIARFFKENLKVYTYTPSGQILPREMYYWSYSVLSENASDFARMVNNNTFSDVSHASIDMSFVTMCYKMGIVFDILDMSRFANTFIDFVYRGRTSQLVNEANGDETPGPFADIINGAYNGDNYYMYVQEGWYRLAKYYFNRTAAAYVVFTSIQDIINSGKYNPTIESIILLNLMEDIYINHDFPADCGYY